MNDKYSGLHPQVYQLVLLAKLDRTVGKTRCADGRTVAARKAKWLFRIPECIFFKFIVAIQVVRGSQGIGAKGHFKFDLDRVVCACHNVMLVRALTFREIVFGTVQAYIYF